MLEEILEEFISKELVVWAKRFPDEFYEEMFRLKKWPYIPKSTKRPRFAGKLTNDLVYEALAPGRTGGAKAAYAKKTKKADSSITITAD